MVAALTAAIAAALYVLSIQTRLAAVVAILVVVLIVVALTVTAGSSLGADSPAVARWLVWTWSPGVLIVLAAVAAVAIHLGVVWAAGDDASAQDQAVAGAIGAVVTAGATSIKSWLETHMAPWIAAKIFCRRYAPLFPCTPVGLGPGRQAQEMFTALCGTQQLTGPQVQELLTRIRAAKLAGEVSGGQNWKCL